MNTPTKLYLNQLLTLVEVAQILGRHLDTVKRQRADRWPNAVQDPDGRKPWRVPVSDLVAAGDLEASEVELVEPTLKGLAESKLVAELRATVETLRIELSGAHHAWEAANKLADDRADTIAFLRGLINQRGAA